jgi:hypothetical protein
VPRGILAAARLSHRVRGSVWLLFIPISLGAWFLAPYIVDMPMETIVGAAGACTLIVAGTLPQFFPRLYAGAYGLLLLGYAFFSRAFSHLGIPPVFVGEIVLAVGLISMLTNPRRWTAFQSGIAWCYLALALWGTARAVPYLPVYGLDVARDSVIWAYGLFALMLPAALMRRDWLPAVLSHYWRFMPFLVIWIPIGLIGGHLFDHFLPLAQDSGQPMSVVKPGDAGVHLGGAVTFLLLGLYRAPGVRDHGGLLRKSWFVGTACMCAFVVVGMLGRGGAVAAMMAIGTVLLLRPLMAAPKLVLVGGGALVGAVILIASNLNVELGRRDISVYQLSSNLISVVGGDVSEDNANLAYTKEWRLRWWTAIVDYTIYGPYRWTGKGFGVNLAIDDGIKSETFNRSPHSGHLNFLARSGIPGFTLWLLLQGVFGVSLLSAYMSARRSGHDWWARLDLWILAYWLAFLTDISFAVYLEGPHGGIWFWSVMGFGIAVLLTQRESLARSAGPELRLGSGHEAAAHP